MAAYFNDSDPEIADWLRRLMARGLIADGVVDDRSIVEVQPDDLRGFTQCHFFAGVGVWSYALRLAGWPDSRSVWTGSPPCQPFSVAGRREGHEDKRHLWPTWFRLVRECCPSDLFGEQVARREGLAWLDVVLSDLESAGYAVAAANLPAAGAGAPHLRERLYFVAHGNRSAIPAPFKLAEPASARLQRGIFTGERADAQRAAAERDRPARFWDRAEWIPCRDGTRRPVEPGSFPLVDGASARVVRLRGYGNAIVGPLAAAFIRAATAAIDDVTEVMT